MVALLARPGDMAQLLGPVRIDHSHPLALGLAFFPWFGHGGPGIDLVNGYGPTTVSGVPGLSEHKAIFNTSNSSANWQEWSGTWLTALLASRTELTIMARFTQRTSTANLQGAFASVCQANGGGYNIIGNQTVPAFYINGGGSVAYTGLSTYIANVTYTFFISGGADATRGLAFQGQALVSNVSTAAIAPSATLSRIRLANERGTSAGGAGTSGYNPIGETNYAAVWNRRLSIPEMMQLASEPYAFVQQRQNVSAFSARSPFRGWGIQLAS